MAGHTLTREQALTMLSATPARIADLTAGLSAAQLNTRSQHDEWSANDVLAHLRACADVRGACALAIIDQDHPTLRAVNPRTWMKKTDYLEQEFHQSFEAFARQRSELVAVLQSLPPDGWSRTATVTGAGRPLEHSVLFYAEWLVLHERPHIKQIEHIVSTVRG